MDSRERVAPFLVPVAAALLLLSAGCDRNQQAPADANAKIEGEGEVTAGQVDHSPDKASPTESAQVAAGHFGSPTDDQRYAGGEADATPEMIPADLLAKLKSHRPDSKQVRDQLSKKIEELRAESKWLDESLDEPIDNSLLTEDGKNPGPNTNARMLEAKALADELLQDYLEHSDDSDADKQLLTELYEKNILDLVSEREPDYEIQTKIFDKFKAGDIDPLVLFLNLSYKNMYSNYRREVSAQVPAGLRSRTCSSATFLKLIEKTSMATGIHSDGEKAWMTKSVLVMLPDFLRRRKADEVYSSHAQAMVVQLRDKMRAEGELDYLRLLLQLRETEPQIVPDSLFHRVLFDLYWSFASKARGGRFINEVSEQKLEVFDEFSEIATDHALAAYLADPGNPYLAKDLLSLELTASSTPLSMHQWYRVAMMTQSDSSYSARKMSWSLMARFGGSRNLVQGYTRRLIEQAMGAPDNQIVFDKAMEKYMQDEGWFGNIAKRSELYESFKELVDHLDELNDGKIDPRLNNLHLVMILRVLWDAGDIERFIRVSESCVNGVSESVLLSRYIPSRLTTLVYRAYEQEGAPKDAIVTLQQELICGDERFDDQRWKRIDDALDVLGRAVKTAPETTEDEKNLTDDENGHTDSVAELLDVMTALRETIGKYHQGQEVNLIDSSIPWTPYGNGYRNTTVSINSSTIDIQVNCQNAYLVMSQPLRFEMPFEVELDVKQGKCDADPYGIALFAGQVSPNSTDSDTSGRSLRYSPGYPMIMQDRLPAERLRGPFYHEQRLIPVPPMATLRMEVREEGVRSFVNDHLITESDGPVDTGGHLQFGRRAGDTFTGVPDKTAIYQITGLRIKKLTG